MRVNLAVHVLSEEVANKMEQNENEATKSTQTYIRKSCLLFNIFNSENSINSNNDPRIKQLDDIRAWFLKWENDIENKYIMPSEVQKHNISWQTRQDVHLTISAFLDLIKYISSEQCQTMYPSKPYIIPKRLSQDIVESWFSQQRACCGSSREPTVMQYGFNCTKLLSPKRASTDIDNTSYGHASIQETNGDKGVCTPHLASTIILVKSGRKNHFLYNKFVDGVHASAKLNERLCTKLQKCIDANAPLFQQNVDRCAAVQMRGK
ncbi:unnamed protein product [Mytilus coruscus]|uniref:Uncharacterized protein n=1 Tax=Mytilus coruscus TaxID=42192 RepID=A0A6J8C1X7_MYTCO|nr:unnamed protein product [Mytilus coruscus]